MDQSMIKFCVNDDGRIAIATGNRPVRYCRPCHLEAHGDQFQEWKVVMPEGLEGVDGVEDARTSETIEPGGTVWLDPVNTNIAALVYMGLIEKVPDAKAASKSAKAAATEA